MSPRLGKLFGSHPQTQGRNIAKGPISQGRQPGQSYLQAGSIGKKGDECLSRKLSNSGHETVCTANWVTLLSPGDLQQSIHPSPWKETSAKETTSAARASSKR